MPDTRFSQDEIAIAYSLGQSCPGEYRVKVVGVSAVFPEVTFFIVEMLDRFPGSEWTHTCVVGSCLKKL